MSEIHIFNSGEGDCILYISNAGRATVFDICCGNMTQVSRLTKMLKASGKGNFGMGEMPENPVSFMKNKMKLSSIFRFILSHPHMDHMDGLKVLTQSFPVLNFWDSGARVPKPDFDIQSKYNENDWNTYQNILNNNENLLDSSGKINVLSPKAGCRNKYFNLDDQGGYGDYIKILSPDAEMVSEFNKMENPDANDISYVILIHTNGGRILLPGDAHDKTWKYVVENYRSDIENCEFMLAPHHGRDSDRSWEFLDVIKPKFSVIGYADSDKLAYNAWNNRNLEKITQNQAGHIAIYDRDGYLDIYIENRGYLESIGVDLDNPFWQGYDKFGNYFLKSIKRAV